MKIFVAGGTGFVGEHLITQLLNSNNTVRLLIHKRTSVLHEGLEYYEGDVTRQSDMNEGIKGCDAVVNLVGIIREFQSRAVTFERLHVQATANLVSAAQSNGVLRYLQMSALGTRPNAVSSYHRTKYRAEEIVRTSKLDWTIFRPSLIYGMHDAFITMLAKQLRLFPVIPVIGNGKYRMQPIHADNVATCFDKALQMSVTIGNTYELCGNDRMTYLQLLDSISAALGKNAAIKLPLPCKVMQKLVPILQKIPQFPITKDQLQMLLEESICDDNSWQELFGIKPKSFDESIREYII